MKIEIANKDDYIRFKSGMSDKLHTFELNNDSKDYIIHRVHLGDGTKDVSLMDLCINNLLDKQYEKRIYLNLEQIREINDMIFKLNKEQCKILNAYSEVKKYIIKDLEEVKELINNIDDYQLLEAHNFREVGILIAKKSPDYKMNINVIPYFDFEKLGRNYLLDSGIAEKFCSYGLLIYTRDILDNVLVETEIEKNQVFLLEVANKKEYEESDLYSKITICIPNTEERINERLKKINLDYDNLKTQDSHITKCKLVNFYDENLTNKFNKMMEKMIEKFEVESGLTTPFQEIQLLCDEVKKFDNTTMSKFLALTETRGYDINYIHDLVEIAKETKNYNLLPDIKNLSDMGEFLVNETGHFDELSILKDYIDYYKLGRDYTKEGCVYQGEFTNYGYLMKKEFLENENNIENEEEFC